MNSTPAVSLLPETFNVPVAPVEMLVDALNSHLELQRYKILYICGNYSRILSRPIKLADQGIYLPVRGLDLALVDRYTAQEIDLYKQTIRAYRSLCRSSIMAENEMRNFALRDAQGSEIGVFTGKQPRQAALKAANRGYTDIKLRERGTKKVHVFT